MRLCRCAIAGKTELGFFDESGVIRLPAGRPIAIKRLVRREPGGWWVQRDNPAQGVDSWQVGVIPDRDVLGVALFRVWPWLRRVPTQHRR